MDGLGYFASRHRLLFPCTTWNDFGDNLEELYWSDSRHDGRQTKSHEDRLQDTLGGD